MRLLVLLAATLLSATAFADTPSIINVQHDVSPLADSNRAGNLRPIVVYDHDALLARAGISGSDVEVVIDYVPGDGLQLLQDQVVAPLVSGQGAAFGDEIEFIVTDDYSAVLSVLVTVYVEGQVSEEFASFEVFAPSAAGPERIRLAEAAKRDATRPRALHIVGPEQPGESRGVPREIIGCGHDVTCLPERLLPRSAR